MREIKCMVDCLVVRLCDGEFVFPVVGRAELKKMNPNSHER